MTAMIPSSPVSGDDTASGGASPAGIDGTEQGRLERPSGRNSWTLASNRLAAVSLSYLLLLALAAVIAPVLAPYDPLALDLGNVLSSPTADHLLGTDPLGRDVLSRLIYGGRISLINAATAALTFLVVGVSSGVTAGFLGGWTDRVFTWVVDVVIAIPGLLVILVVLAVFGSNMTIAMVAFGILAAPGFARVLRGVTLAVRQELFVAAARVSGLPNRRIVVQHVLPRVSGPILVHVSLFCGAALLVDAGLAYLGFGVQPPTPTWGGMIIEAGGVVNQQPWLLVPPGVTLALAILAFALLGDSVRDATAVRTGRAPIRVGRRRAHTTKSRGNPHATPKDHPTALLSVRGMSVSLPKADDMITVVENVDLEIQAGETVGLVGESGCGKSISGNAILGLLPAGGSITMGTIHFDGSDLTTLDPRMMRQLRGSQIAMISQEPIASLDPMFTVSQQVQELVKRHHGGSRQTVKARTLDLLDSVKLPEPESVARRYPHELSGGMAQRVAIAMALAGEPALLIADEPTTALDVTVQAEILELLRRLQAERDMAILLISHDWGVIANTCRRAYVMYAGHIVESCTVKEMFTYPSHPYTVGLLASTPRRADPGEPLRAIPGAVPDPTAWPDGCHFAPRCELATDDCRVNRIPLLNVRAEHHTRCIHHTQIRHGEHRD